MSEEKQIRLLRIGLSAGAVLYVLGALFMTGLIGLKGDMRHIQYIPFAFVNDFAVGAASVEVMLWNTICNVILFVPFGVLLPALFPRVRFGAAVLAGFAGSLVIELAQYVLCAGVSDVDDLILNTLGTLVGAGLYFGLFRRCGGEKRILAVSFAFLAVLGCAVVCALFLR